MKLSRADVYCPALWILFNLQKPIKSLVIYFQAIKEALDTIQPSVESAETTKDELLNNANPDEKAKINKLMDRLRREWNVVNRDYADRHR